MIVQKYKRTAKKLIFIGAIALSLASFIPKPCYAGIQWKVNLADNGDPSDAFSIVNKSKLAGIQIRPLSSSAASKLTEASEGLSIIAEYFKSGEIVIFGDMHRGELKPQDDEVWDHELFLYCVKQLSKRSINFSVALELPHQLEDILNDRSISVDDFLNKFYSLLATNVSSRHSKMHSEVQGPYLSRLLSALKRLHIPIILMDDINSQRSDGVFTFIDEVEKSNKDMVQKLLEGKQKYSNNPVLVMVGRNHVVPKISSIWLGGQKMNSIPGVLRELGASSKLVRPDDVGYDKEDLAKFDLIIKTGSSSVKAELTSSSMKSTDKVLIRISRQYKCLGGGNDKFMGDVLTVKKVLLRQYDYLDEESIDVILVNAMHNALGHSVDKNNIAEVDIIAKTVNNEIVLQIYNNPNKKKPLSTVIKNKRFYPSSDAVLIPDEDRNREGGNNGQRAYRIACYIGSVYQEYFLPENSNPSVGWFEVEKDGKPKVLFELRIPILTENEIATLKSSEAASSSIKENTASSGVSRIKVFKQLLESFEQNSEYNLDIIKQLKIDPRPINFGLLSPSHVGHNMALKKEWDPNDEEEIGLVAGAGANFSGFLLRVNTPKSYFVEWGSVSKKKLDEYLAQWDEIEKLDEVKDYLSKKKELGLGPSNLGMLNIEAKIILELKAMDVLRRSINFEYDDNNEYRGWDRGMHKPVIITFKWKPYGAAEFNDYSVTYLHNVDIVYSEDHPYPDILNNVLDAGIDVFDLQAGLDIVRSYEMFMDRIAESVNDDGAILADDYIGSAMGSSSEETFLTIMLERNKNVNFTKPSESITQEMEFLEQLIKQDRHSSYRGYGIPRIRKRISASSGVQAAISSKLERPLMQTESERYQDLGRIVREEDLVYLFAHLDVDRDRLFEPGYLADVCKRNKIRRILDVGGGDNALLMALLKQHVGKDVELYEIDPELIMMESLQKVKVHAIREDIMDVDVKDVGLFDIIFSTGLATKGGHQYWPTDINYLEREVQRTREKEWFALYAEKLVKKMMSLLSKDNLNARLIVTKTAAGYLLIRESKAREMAKVLYMPRVKGRHDYNAKVAVLTHKSSSALTKGGIDLDSTDVNIQGQASSSMGFNLPLKTIQQFKSSSGLSFEILGIEESVDVDSLLGVGID